MSNHDDERKREQHTSDANGLTSVDAIKHPSLPTADEYRKRTEAAQSSIHKSLLILLGLLAFLLAIENSYSRFTDLFNQYVSRQQVITTLDKTDSEILVLVNKVDMLTAGSALVEENDNSSKTDKKIEAAIQNLKYARKKLADGEVDLNEIEKKIGELKKESVDLSIAGTKLPSQLCFAPTVWLMTLLCWVLYFDARRATAQRNLAAFHLALTESQRSFGAAGDGTMWIAPLPQFVRLSQSTGGDSCVPKNDLLLLLGWSLRSERRFQLAILVFALITQLVLLRVVFIAYEMTGDFAIERNFSPRMWQIPGTMIPVFVAIVCSFKLLRLPFTPADSADLQSSAIATRREFLGGMFGLLLAFTAWKYRNPIFASANRQGLVRLDAASRAKPLSNPRYILQQRRAKRLSQYQVVIPVVQKVTLLYSMRKRPLESRHRPRVVTLHYANKDGKVRLFSTAGIVRSIAELSVADADTWVKNTPKNTLTTARHTAPTDPKTLPLNTKRTWVWEALALDRVESGDVERACALLIVGAKLALLAPLTEPMNLRLLDLLAGLAVRTGNEAQYLTPLKVLVQARIARLRKLRVALDNQLVMGESGIGRHSRSIASSPKDKSPAPSQPALSPLVTADRVVRPNPGHFDRLNAYAELLERRHEKWENHQLNWRKRWSDKTRPIWWHHPMETRQFESPRHAKSQSEQKYTETRQRPIRIT